MPSLRRRSVVGLLVLACAVVGACDSALSVSDQPVVGAVSLRSVPNAARGAVVGGDAFFLSGSSLSVPDPSLVPDSCVLQAVDTSVTFNRGNTAAGNAIGLRVGSADGSMPLSSSESRYLIAPGTRLDYQFGDSVRITVPGQAGGFPAASTFAPLAEPFTLAAFTPPAVGQPAAFRWSPAGTTQSAIVLTVRFRPAMTGQTGRQALCSLRDDGVFDMPARIYDGLRDTGVLDRLTAVRFRTRAVEVSRRATLYVLSSFEVNVPPR
ncbi:MAG: hypothetical protein MUF00_16770 [Gemmatimonadaceae bacterium]|jgi:hypothetical protein|nr:hypothetical protein [Gemmatimonadaceae bacterium]